MKVIKVDFRANKNSSDNSPDIIKEIDAILEDLEKDLLEMDNKTEQE